MIPHNNSTSGNSCLELKLKNQINMSPGFNTPDTQERHHFHSPAFVQIQSLIDAPALVPHESGNGSGNASCPHDLPPHVCCPLPAPSPHALSCLAHMAAYSPHDQSATRQQPVWAHVLSLNLCSGGAQLLTAHKHPLVLSCAGCHCCCCHCLDCAAAS